MFFPPVVVNGVGFVPGADVLRDTLVLWEVVDGNVFVPGANVLRDTLTI